MKYSEEKLRKYVERCFKDAFEAEGREFDKDKFSFEWVMVKNKEGAYQLYSTIDCAYRKVVTRVVYRLKNNLMKNFGIHYMDTDSMRCMLCVSDRFDFNFTKAVFSKRDNKRIKYVLDIFDAKTNPYENDKLGECMPAYTYEKLLFEYFNLCADDYKDLEKTGIELHIAKELSKKWDAFRALYKNTFDHYPDEEYAIICSSGLEQLYI